MITRKALNEFEEILENQNLSQLTIDTYKVAVRQFFSMYASVTHKNLLHFKNYLTENYKVKTVNIKILGINRYLDVYNYETPRLRTVKLQQKNFLENVISDADYNFLKRKLKKENKMLWYFVVRFLGATGARVSELVQIKVEHVEIGHLDLYGKAGKVRRLYIPAILRKEALEWFEKENMTCGYIFINRLKKRLTPRGIAMELKKFAYEYGLKPEVVYPHSFRHRFAKNFIEKYNDIALLADLMGHDSIETTRIYLRKTSTEQQRIIDKFVTW